MKNKTIKNNSFGGLSAEDIIVKQKDEIHFLKQQIQQLREELFKTNELLYTSEEKFSMAFKHSPVIISLSTVSEGKYVDVSDNFYTVSGWTKEEVIGHTAHDINIWVDEYDRQLVVRNMREKGCMRELEIRFRKKNGDIRTMLFSGDIIVVGGVQCLITINSDITDRILAEESNRSQKIELEKVNAELKRSISDMQKTHADLLETQKELLDSNMRLQFSEEKFSKAVHLGPVVITLSRLSDGVYIDVSDYFLEVMGYTRDEVIGHSAVDLNIWDNVEDRNRIMEALKRDGLVRGVDISFGSRTRSHNTYIMNYSAEIINISGELHLVSVAVDVTEKKKAEYEKSTLQHQLQQSQKMETVGRLAGGIAHDFNNLLTAILGNVELCMLKTERENAIYHKLEMIKKASESAADLTRRILAFSRKQIIEPEVIDLNEVISNMNKMLSRLIGENIRLDAKTDALYSKIVADPVQIEQIILNLSVNSRDAMPAGGSLVIATGNVSLDDEYCKTHAYMIPGEYVLLSVTDTGTGMTDEVMEHLFEPFYTTKSKGQGTGLGLSMVYGSVKQNNGLIEVRSSVGRGTRFEIYFPVHDGNVIYSPSSADPVVQIRGKETILLVEDNTMVLEFATNILENAGFTVLEAQNGENALLVESAFSGKIDLILTDVIMPGLDGKSLAEILSVKRPDMKVILTSGYTENIIKQQNITEGLSFISKPYSAVSLLRKIREVLDR